MIGALSHVGEVAIRLPGEFAAVLDASGRCNKATRLPSDSRRSIDVFQRKTFRSRYWIGAVCRYVDNDFVAWPTYDMKVLRSSQAVSVAYVRLRFGWIAWRRRV